MMSRRWSRMRRGNYREGESGDHWMSYTDLMSALLLMFTLFLMINLLEHQRTIEKKDAVIKEVIGVKTKIIEELKKAFSDSNLNMEVDPQTGAIRFSDGVFFAYKSYEVSEGGRKTLEEFIPKYINILLSDRFRDHIAQIIVEGHTDQQGTYLYNLDLSQKRSYAVVKEIFSDSFPNFAHKDQLRSLLTSNGRSFSEPIKGKNGQIDADKSRRVEFKFRLKDEEVIEEIQKMVNENEQ
jgi:outer membrane protein OmpA-like peptidoglycan-associated protein